MAEILFRQFVFAYKTMPLGMKGKITSTFIFFLITLSLTMKIMTLMTPGIAMLGKIMKSNTDDDSISNSDDVDGYEVTVLTIKRTVT